MSSQEALWLFEDLLRPAPKMVDMDLAHRREVADLAEAVTIDPPGMT
jgi:hypothetical protein